MSILPAAPLSAAVTRAFGADSVSVDPNSVHLEEQMQNFELRQTPLSGGLPLGSSDIYVSSGNDDLFDKATVPDSPISPESRRPSSTNSSHAQADEDSGYAEGGYGWVIVACTFVLAFHFLGGLYSWGVIQSELQKQGIGSPEVPAWIGGVLAFTFAASTAPGSIIVRTIGDRKSCMAASIVMACSCMTLSFLTRHLAAFFILHAGLNSACSGLAYISAYTLPSQWFKRRRGLATGIMSCGGGVGGAVWSVVLQQIIARLGLPWAFRIFGFSMLATCMPEAYFLRPGVAPPNPVDLSGAKIHQPSILKNKLFLVLLLSCIAVSYPFFIPPFFVPLYSDAIGLPASTGATLSAAFNLASGAGRIGFGYLADSFVGNFQAFTLALLSVALSSLLIWPFALTTGAVAGFCVWCGLGSGGFFSLQSSLAGQLLGSHRVPQAVSIIELTGSIGFGAGPVTAGYLLQAFGGLERGPSAFKPAMYITGGATFFAAVLAMVVRFGVQKKIWAKV